MHPRVPQRAGAVTGRGEGLHQPQGKSRAEGIEYRESPPPLCRRAVIASRRCGRCEALDRPLGPRRQARALGVDPVLELRRVAQKEPVEEGAGVEGGGALGVPSIERLFELPGVGAQRRRVEAQLARTEEQVVGCQVAAEGVQGLVQEMTCLVGAALRPEVAEELVAADAPFPSGSEERKQSQGPPLSGRPQHGPGVALHREAPQSSQPQRARRHVSGSAHRRDQSSILGACCWASKQSRYASRRPASKRPISPEPIASAPRTEHAPRLMPSSGAVLK